MLLNAIIEKLKHHSRHDFKGRQFEAWLIIQAVSWYLRYPMSYRDLEEMFLERSFEVDHSTINRWILAYAPLIEKRLRQFRQPHCGSIRKIAFIISQNICSRALNAIILRARRICQRWADFNLSIRLAKPSRDLKPCYGYAKDLGFPVVGTCLHRMI